MALEDRLEFGKPGGMGRPRWAGDEVAVGDGVGDFDGGIGAAGVFYFRGAGGIGAKALAFYDARGSENLRAMAERGDGLIGFGEMADEFEDFGFECGDIRERGRRGLPARRSFRDGRRRKWR